jgi:hypothetical protein
MKAVLLPDRGVVKVVGDASRGFLHNLVTADVQTLVSGAARYAALLTPQGKIVADFIIAAAPEAQGGGFFLDLPLVLAKPVVAKLNMYKLRAAVMIEDLSDVIGVAAAWDGAGSTTNGLAYADPRLPALGLRVMLPPQLFPATLQQLGAAIATPEDYDAHRIALGIPQGGSDFQYGDAFPHEIDMDQLGGVDFTKGCYVGQEVVSRMEHRSTARTRAIAVRYAGAAPAQGAAVTAGDRTLGTMGSAKNGRGIAMLRLDRLAEALSRGDTLSVGATPIAPVKPVWAHFDVPGATEAAE